jgi:MFS family permease
MIILDSTIVNVALPSIQADLGFSQSALAWVVKRLPHRLRRPAAAGRPARRPDRPSARFLAGLTVFTIASLACGLAPSKETLIAARFIQGIGGAVTSAVILGMIVTMFREPGEQAKAIGVYSFIASAGASIGLLLGGVLTQAINWHWIFFVNVPIGLLTGLFALRLVRDNEGIGLRSGAGTLGALLVTGALMLGVYTILEAGGQGWTSLHTLGFGAAALGLLAGFVGRESRTTNPLVPLAIFGSRNISGANAIQALMAGMFGMFFMGVLYLQRVLGLDAIQMGLAFLPVSVLIGALSLGVSARLNATAAMSWTCCRSWCCSAPAQAYRSHR